MLVSTDTIKKMIETAKDKTLAEIRDDDSFITQYMEKSFNSGIKVFFHELLFDLAEYELNQMEVSKQ